MTAELTVTQILSGQIRKDLLVPWYMMLSYLYYEHDKQLVPDHTFDLLCKTLLNQFDSVEHQHLKFVSKDSLRAGTGFDIPAVCPGIAKGAAERLWNEEHPKDPISVDWEKHMAERYPVKEEAQPTLFDF
jgi:hypothetical protein